MKIENQHKIILFDGVCNLCNTSVRFILNHERQKQFLFASLQSDAASKFLLQLNEENINLDTIILIKDKRVYKKSSAVLHIIKDLSPLWNLLYILIIIPKFIRDPLYQFIAKRRYKWFGQRDVCTYQIDANKNRFIR